MKKAVFAALCAAACCAFAALKPGYRYHGDLKPSDQVPANYETVISNYLEQSGYAPTVTTNREYIVQSVTNNFYEVHSVTNRFYDEKWVTNSIVTNIYQVTHEDHYVTNTVQRNFVQNFEYWHTNNFYEVTNVTVYLTTETTNVIWNVTTNTVVEPHYVVSNFVDHTYHTNEYYTFETREVTNRITSVIETLYTNIVTREDHYIDRYYTTHKTNNYYFVTNLVTHEDHWVTNNFAWTTNIVTREDHWITNNVIDTHEDHWITNNIIYTHEDHYVTNNFYEVTNFVEHTYHTNNFYETVYQTTNVYHTVYETTNLYHNVYETNNLTTVSNIYHNTYTDHWHTNNLVEHTWHTNNLVVNTLSNVFVTVNVTNREDYYVYTTERVTNEVETVKYITDVYVTSNLTVVGTNHSHYSHWYTDRISATNGFSVCEIDALNRIYTQVDEQGFYGKKVKGSSLWNTFDANRYTRYVAFYDNPIWYPNPLDTTFPLDMLEGTDGNDGMVLYGKFMPIFEYMSESRQYSGFLVLGGWLSISGTTTNWVTSKTAPALNHVIRNYYSETTTYITWTNGTYLASANLPASFRTKAGTMWYNPKNGKIIYAYPYSGSQSYLGNYIYWQTSENTADKMITNRVYTVGQLATVDELADYSSAHTASEVVTNSTFVSMVTDAMYPYTLMSLTNAQNAAASAAAAAGSATTAKSYSDNMPAQVQSAVSSATATATTAARNAQSAMSNIQTLANTASTAASSSQSYANDAQRTYGLIQAFTNWFYNALVSGGVVTNVNITMDITVGVGGGGSATFIADDGTATALKDTGYTVPGGLQESGWSGSSYSPNALMLYSETVKVPNFLNTIYNVGGEDIIIVRYKNSLQPASGLYRIFPSGSNNPDVLYKHGLSLLRVKKSDGNWYWACIRGTAFRDSDRYSNYYDNLAGTTMAVGSISAAFSASLNGTKTYTPSGYGTMKVGYPRNISLATTATLYEYPKDFQAEENNGVIKFSDGYTIPTKLKRYTPSNPTPESLYGYFTLQKVVVMDSNYGGSKVVQVCYKNDYWGSWTPGDNFCMYKPYGVTFMQERHADGNDKWRIWVNRGGEYSYSGTDGWYDFSRNLNRTFTVHLTELSEGYIFAPNSDATLHTVTHTADFASQKELNSASNALAQAASSARTAADGAWSYADAVSNTLVQAIASHATSESTTRDTAISTAIGSHVTSFMSDLSSILTSNGETFHVCDYDVYFDTAGQVQGKFTLDTGRYDVSGRVRIYQIYNIRTTSYTSSTYGQLAAVTYTWNPTSGALTVRLLGTKGSSRTYTATQNTPIANYYGSAWSVLKTTDSTYGGSGPQINTTGKAYLNPLVRLLQAAGNTNTTYIIGN